MSRKSYNDLSRSGKYNYLQDLKKKRMIEDEAEAGPSQIHTDKVPRLCEARINEIPAEQGNASNNILEDEVIDGDTGSIMNKVENQANKSDEQNNENSDPYDEEQEDEIEAIGEESDEQDDENSDPDDEEQEDGIEAIGEESDEQDDESCSEPENEEQENESEAITDESDDEEVDDDNAGEPPQPPHGNDNNRPLYAGAPITIAESMLLILSLLLKHNITGTCLSDIITVINFHCLARGLKSNSLYKFRKYFSASEKPFNKHFYCSTCMSSLESESTMCMTCNAKKKVCYFIVMPFLKQLKEMFNRQGFPELLQHRFNRHGMARGTPVCDISDGSLYSRYVETGFLTNPYNISLTWYTDRVPVFKSSKVSMWPVYLTINELPYKYRMKRENTMLAALWCGNKKPAANHFIYTMRSEFEKLLRGTPCTLSDGRVVDVRGILLAGTCDLPAKAQFLNMTAYNGNFGCRYCKNPGESFAHPSGGTSHVYKYVTEPEMRTTAETIRNANQALLDSRPVNGVKGPCSFSKLMPDFIEGIAIDYMHGIFCGITKRLLNLWLDSSFSTCPFSLYSVLAIINEKLLQIKPPKFVHRMPRSVEDLCHWKASELRMWFFYYSLPVLKGIMRPDYFEHYALLVTAVALLNSDSITRQQLDTAKNLLHKFVREFEDFYGLRFCTINVHQLLHLPVCVERLGPLWVYSCFPYEDLNGKLLTLVHGTSNIECQIASAHTYLLKMKIQLDQLPPGPVRDLAIGVKRQVKICQRVFEGCYSVGTYKKYDTLPDFLEQEMLNSHLPLGNVQCYTRLLKDGKLIISETYTRTLRTSSSHVLYNGQNGQKMLGTVLNFIKISLCGCVKECFCEGDHYAVVTQIVRRNWLQVTGDNGVRCDLSHLHQCHRTDNTSLISVAALQSVCVSVVIDNELYVGTPINSMELE